MKSIYKNYELEPSSDRLVETGQWSTHIKYNFTQKKLFCPKRLLF